MKIKTTVKRVAAYDDLLRVTLEKQAEYANERTESEVYVPNTEKSRRAYYVGRTVTLSTQPL